MNQKFRPILATIFAFFMTATLSFLITKNQDGASAADAHAFRAGNIISDYVMSNNNSMSVSEINDFLHSKNPCNDTNLAKVGYYLDMGIYHIENGHFVCLADETFDGRSAAQIIYDVAREYRINPQVLIVLLEKEQSLITDTYPYHNQIAYALGYGCYDDAEGCRPQYGGFETQLSLAAELFREVLDGGWSNYHVGDNYVQFHPDSGCGGTIVNIENLATASLYRYTPYQPNQSALDAGYGTGDYCASYGNRNFFLLFSDWFGDPTATSAYEVITKKYNSLGGEAVLGKPKTPLQSNASTGIQWIEYERGFIVGRNDTGFYESSGKIRDFWANSGFESGQLGFPIGDVYFNSATGVYYQEYQRGYIVGNDEFGFHDSHGKIRAVWGANGYEAGKYGYPTSNIATNPNTGIYYQFFQNGAIVGRNDTGFYESSGKIRDFWANNDFEYGKYGLPVSDIIKDGDISYQKYQNGIIYYSPQKGAWGSP